MSTERARLDDIHADHVALTDDGPKDFAALLPIEPTRFGGSSRREEGGVEDVHVYLVSKIGAPVNEPRALEIVAKSKLPKKDLQAMGQQIAGRVLKGMPKLWEKLLDGRHQVC